MELGQRESKHLTKPQRGGTRECSYKRGDEKTNVSSLQVRDTGGTHPGDLKGTLEKKENNLHMNRKLHKKVTIIK